MIVYRVILLCLFSFFCGQIKSQLPIDSTNFRSPLKIPLSVSGNFCELRPNHFHTGLDLKTESVIGKEVVSIDEGYVSRIYYSHWGYGLAVYINHPSGYTSLYAHLSKFSDKIAKKVKEIQYANKSETFDLTFNENEIKLSKGELIGLSGSSGSSYAPHLHFEIRETKSDLAVNPLLFGFNIKDNINPDIKGIKFYPISEDATINGMHKEYYVPVKKTKEQKFSLKNEVKAFGTIGLGIHTTDQLNGAGNICGVYRVDMIFKDELVFNHEMKYMNFNLSRYINIHKDYREYYRNNRNIHKNFILGNNPLPIYGTKLNNGLLTIETDSSYSIHYDVWDAYKNKSSLNFTLMGESAPKNKMVKDIISCTRYLRYDVGEFFDTTNFTLLMGKGSIYENHCFNYYTIKDSSYLSDIHVVNSVSIPVQGYFEMQIKPRNAVNKHLQEKLLVVELNEKGYPISKGGVFVDEVVHTRVRSYGKYAIMIDTIAPVIISLMTEKELSKITPNCTITFKIGDNLAGIDSYHAYVNGDWILSNYDRKKNKLSVNLSNNDLKAGKIEMLIEVTDERGNKGSQTIQFDIN